MFGLGGSDLSMVSSRLRVRASSCSSCLQTSFCSGPADAPSRSQRSLRAFDWNTGHIDDSFLLTREEARIKFIFVHESLWKEELQKHVLKVHSWSAHYEAHHRSCLHHFFIKEAGWRCAGESSCSIGSCEWDRKSSDCKQLTDHQERTDWHSDPLRKQLT